MGWIVSMILAFIICGLVHIVGGLVHRAGVADAYECGIFSRVTGWLDASGLKYEMTPSLGKCQKTQGQECSYSFKLHLSAG